MKCVSKLSTLGMKGENIYLSVPIVALWPRKVLNPFGINNPGFVLHRLKCQKVPWAFIVTKQRRARVESESRGPKKNIANLSQGALSLARQ
jgi:hypothetical protein